ncbi:MAG: ATP-binding cassette domain-containing protein [Bacteroidia bacterium]|jgi:ABC-type multidrug transport system ATPase subunit|nr:ATP-binding cassette domain-containing protein [Bacteroidia bacterium]MDG2042689.1 ATP-binding cassette domain-containing protein [Bacteroidia bacterium]
MTQIDCIGISKRFNRDILFRDFTYKFKNTDKYAIIGENSSGKSTLLKIIGGVLSATKGEINYSSDIIQSNQISYSSPEMDLLNDYSIQELFDFHFQFKKPKISIKEQLNTSGLSNFRHKKYSNLSSGIINKVKLTLALFTDTPVLLLDEPCTNFDLKNNQWYFEIINNYCLNQMIIVASNDPNEYSFCNELINIQHFK